MSKVHSDAFKSAFGYTLASEMKGSTKCQRWSNAAKGNITIGLLSYIPIVNLIALPILISQIQKESKGEALKSQDGKAYLARTILLFVGLIPVVMLLDTIATLMKCCEKCKKVSGQQFHKPKKSKPSNEHTFEHGSTLYRSSRAVGTRPVSGNPEAEWIDMSSSSATSASEEPSYLAQVD